MKTTVISPLAIHRALVGRDPFHAFEDAGDGAVVTVFRPRFISVSNKGCGRCNTFRLTLSEIRRASRSVFLRHFAELPDAFYGHFLYPAGAIAVSLGNEWGVPSFPAAGEISLETVDPIGKEQAGRELSRATAFIANSTHLARLMTRELGLNAERIGVFPNGINRRMFYPRDRSAMRVKYRLPAERFLLVFVGSFEPRKGARRVAAAIQGLHGVTGVFVGSGPEPPAGENVLCYGPLPHERIPEILSAADVFILPSGDEGCCNAILEALACGLPIISSTGAFNDEILNDAVSIRVDPLDLSGLRRGIVHLRDGKGTRREMGQAALSWAENFDVDRRAQAMLRFMASYAAKQRGPVLHSRSIQRLTEKTV